MKASVLLPVYNGQDFLKDACDSVFAQSFTDFELLAIDDGSTDDSLSILNSYNDPRMIIHRNESNLGLIATLNKGIDLARGEYIIRMDADDMSLPDRFAEQISFMDENPEVVISGTLYEHLDDPSVAIIKQPNDPEEIKCRLFFHTVLAHPTVIYRREDMISNGLYYNAEYKHAEDFELWVRASRLVKISNLGKVLLRYRHHADQVSRTHSDIQISNLNRCRRQQLEEIGIESDEVEKQIHYDLCNHHYSKDMDFVKQSEEWLMKLYQHNRSVKFFDDNIFSKIIGEYWIAVCRNAGKDVHKVFKASKLNSLNFLTLAQKLKYNLSL